VRSLGLAPHVGQGYAVLALLGMVVLSMFILRRVTDTPRDWAALGAQ
jgi:hypothetical protein